MKLTRIWRKRRNIQIDFCLNNLEDKRYANLVETAGIQVSNKTTGFTKFDEITTWIRNTAVEKGLIKDHATCYTMANQRHILAMSQGGGSEDDDNPKPPAKRKRGFTNHHKKNRKNQETTNTKHRSKEEWWALEPEEREQIMKERNNKKKQRKNTSYRKAAATESGSNRSSKNPPTQDTKSVVYELELSDSSDKEDGDASAHMGQLGTTRYPNGRPKHRSHNKKMQRFTKAIVSSARSIAEVKVKQDLTAIAQPDDPPIEARFEYGSHADTCCLGKGWTVLDDTGKTCTVHSF